MTENHVEKEVEKKTENQVVTHADPNRVLTVGVLIRVKRMLDEDIHSLLSRVDTMKEEKFSIERILRSLCSHRWEPTNTDYSDPHHNHREYRCTICRLTK